MLLNVQMWCYVLLGPMLAWRTEFLDFYTKKRPSYKDSRFGGGFKHGKSPLNHGKSPLNHNWLVVSNIFGIFIPIWGR